MVLSIGWASATHAMRYFAMGLLFCQVFMTVSTKDVHLQLRDA